MDERSRKDRSGKASAFVACPGCGQPMQTLRLARKPHGDVDVDFCVDCQMLWFDAYESVQLTPGSTLTEQELKDFVAARLAAFKVPVRIEIRREPLPRNASGKLLKSQIKREMAGEDQGRGRG